MTAFAARQPARHARPHPSSAGNPPPHRSVRTHPRRFAELRSRHRQTTAKSLNTKIQPSSPTDCYAREWNYRFNRRTRIADLADFVLRRAMARPTITYQQLVNGLQPQGALPALAG